MVPKTRDSIGRTLSENGAKILQATRDTVPRTVSTLLKVKNYVNARPTPQTHALSDNTFKAFR